MQFTNQKLPEPRPVFQHEHPNRIVEIGLEEITVHQLDEAISKTRNFWNLGRIAFVVKIKIFGLLAVLELTEKILREANCGQEEDQIEKEDSLHDLRIMEVRKDEK